MHLIFLALSIAFIFYQRAPLNTELLIDWDESIYFYMAQRTAEDWVPYISAFDHKGPLLFWALAPVAYFFSPEIAPLRIYTTAVLALSMIFVYGAAYEFSQKKYTSLLAPILYACHFFHFKGLAVNAEVFSMAPVCLCVWLFFRGERTTHSVPSAFFQGLLAAAAFFTRLNIVISLVWIPLLYLWRSYRKQNQVMWRKQFYSFCAGGLTLSFLIFGVFAFAGALSQFWHDYFLYNLGYAATATLRYTTAALLPFRTSWPLFLGTVCFLVSVCFFKKYRDRAGIVLLLLALSSIVGAIAPGHPHHQYLLQLALPLSLFPILLSYQLPATGGRTLCILFLGLILLRYRGSGPLAINFTKIHKAAGLAQAADTVSTLTKKGDEIFVWAEDSVIYYLSNRRSPFRHFNRMFYRKSERDRRHIEPNFDHLRSSPPKVIVYKRTHEYPLPKEIFKSFELVEKHGEYEVFLRKS